MLQPVAKIDYCTKLNLSREECTSDDNSMFVVATPRRGFNSC